MFFPLTPKNRSAFASVFFVRFSTRWRQQNLASVLKNRSELKPQVQTTTTERELLNANSDEVCRLSQLKTKGNPHMEDFARNISTDGVEDLERKDVSGIEWGLLGRHFRLVLPAFDNVERIILGHYG